MLVVPPGSLRLILALIVMASHYSQLAGSPLSAPIDGVAVVGFFFLSGYWVTCLWERVYRTLPNRITTFYISRAWRIYPLAAIGTTLMLITTPTTTTTLLWNYGLAGLQLEKAFNPPNWSLAVEVQFYLTFPALVLLLQQRAWTWAITTVGAACWVLFANDMMPTSLAVFILPIALGVLFAQSGNVMGVTRLANLSAFVFLVAGVLPNVTSIPPITGSLDARSAVILLSLVSLPYIAASLLQTSSARDKAIGDLAFPIYVAHWPAYLIADRLLPGGGIALAVIITFMISLGLTIFVDRPSERLRRAFIRRQASSCKLRWAE